MSAPRPYLSAMVYAGAIADGLNRADAMHFAGAPDMARAAEANARDELPRLAAALAALAPASTPGPAAEVEAIAARWRAVRPDAVVGGSDAQSRNVLADALADIRRLAALAGAGAPTRTDDGACPSGLSPAGVPMTRVPLVGTVTGGAP